MARPGITKSEVAEAVTALRAQGKPASTRAVRLELGRGSYATIGQCLEELGAKSSGRPPGLPEIPEAVQRRISASTHSMWEAMASIAQTERSALQKHYEQRLHNIGTQLALEKSTRKRVESDLSRALTQASAFKSKSEALELEIAGTKERLAVAQALLDRSERERDRLLARLEPANCRPLAAERHGALPSTTAERTQRPCLSKRVAE